MARKSRKHLQHAQVEENKQNQYTAGIYARTSSEEQKGNSIENQIQIAKTYIQSKAEIKLHKTYVDYGVSSFAHARPSFKDMILDAEAKVIDCIIVKDISRFSRNHLETGDFLERKFPLWGTRFIAISDDLDTLCCDATKMEIALKSIMYYSTSLDISQRTQSAIAVLQRYGSYVPARLPYGYIKEQTEEGIKWSLNEGAASIVQQIFERALSGLSAYAIASELNNKKIPSPNSDFWTSKTILGLVLSR